MCTNIELKQQIEDSNSALENQIVESNNRNIEQHRDIIKQNIKIVEAIDNINSVILDIKLHLAKNDGMLDSASGFSKTQKILLSIAATLIIFFSGLSANYQREAVKQAKSGAQAKVDAYKAIDDINKKMDAFTGTAIMDTLIGVRRDIHNFYIGEWQDEVNKTNKMYQNEIKINTKARKRGSVILKDHEFRISKLESK
jgi:hypothetical protein